MASGRAKQLRQQPTDAEIRLWSRLRRKQLDGLRFRRQAPIEPYIVDFFCPEAKLVVEVDGGQHAEQQDYDDRRTRWLEERGYRGVRFWNNDVLANTEGVLGEILRAVGESPPSLTLPLQGGGNTSEFPIAFLLPVAATLADG